MSDFIADWKLVSSENFEELMKALDVGYFMRKIGASLKPNVKFTVNNDEWTMTTTSTFSTNVIKFKLDKEFEEKTVDGRICKSIITFDGKKLIHTQKDQSGKVQCVVTREITPKGEMKTLAKAGKVESLRVYVKEQ